MKQVARDLMTIKNIIRLFCSLCAALAFVQSILSVLRECGWCHTFGAFLYAFSVIVVAGVILLANGFLIEGFLVRKAVIRLNRLAWRFVLGVGIFLISQELQ